MKPKAIGIVILIIGIIMLIFSGMNYVTTEKVVDIGPIKIEKEKNHPLHWSPIIGVALIAGGIIIMAVDRKR
jgi:hypothetical protein